MLTAADQVGVVLGNTYRLERRIGAGGMGSVYEASHLRVPRRFAVKLLNPEMPITQPILERFQREAEIAGSLGDEHITQVFDFNRADDGTPYMVLELLDGEDLSQRLARGPLSLPDTVELMVQVTGALQKAHQAGIIHRDLKPSNLFLCRSERGLHVKVMDFGISKVLHQTGTGTRTGMILGTPNYMSPEQAQGMLHEVDLRSDIFALGTILYECLTGRMAFTGPTPVAAIISVCQSEPVQITQIAPNVPEAIARVVRRALSKAREDRHASVLELRDELLRATQGTAMAPTIAVGHAGASGQVPAFRPPSNQPPFAPPSNQPPFAPPSNQPPFAPPSNQPPFAPPSNQPPFAPPSNRPPFAPPSTLGIAPGEIASPSTSAQPPRRRGFAAAVAAIAVVAIGVAVMATRGGSSPQPPVAAGPTTVAPPTTAPPTTAATQPTAATAQPTAATAQPTAATAQPTAAAVQPTAAAVQPAAAQPTAAAAQPTAAAAQPTAAATIRVALEVSPPDAKIELDGKPLTDRELVVAPGRELHFIVRAAGYQTLRTTRTLTADGPLSLQLARQKAGPGPRTKKPDDLVEDKW